MPTERPAQSIRLTDILRSGIVPIAVLGLLGFALGFLMSTRSAESASATTSILVNPLDGNPFNPSARGEQLVNLETEAQAVRSTDVAELVATSTGTEMTTKELLSGISVSVPVNTQILEMAFESADPDTAKEMSQAFAENYLDYRNQSAQDRITEQTDQLQAQIDQSEAQLKTLAQQLAKTPANSAEASILRQGSESIASQVDSLAIRKAELTGSPLDAGYVITPAELAKSGVLNTKVILPLAGLFLGLLAGFVLAMVRSQANPTLRREADVEALGVKVLGSWSSATMVTHALSDDDVAQHVEQVRKICVAVLALERRRPFSMLVTPVSTDAQGSELAEDMATALSSAGLETIVIDATTEGRGPAQRSGFGAEPGLSDVLTGDAVITGVLQPAGPLLWLLPPGESIGEVSDLFVGEPMERALSGAKGLCDVVLIAGGSIQDSNAQSMASFVESVVFEVERNRSSQTELTEALHATDLLGSGLVGAVFVSSTRDRSDRFRWSWHSSSHGSDEAVGETDDDDVTSRFLALTGALRRDDGEAGDPADRDPADGTDVRDADEDGADDQSAEGLEGAPDQTADPGNGTVGGRRSRSARQGGSLRTVPDGDAGTKGHG